MKNRESCSDGAKVVLLRPMRSRAGVAGLLVVAMLPCDEVSSRRLCGHR
jgi:hypothetical protein